AFCFETPFPIINQETVCRNRKRQGDGRTFTGIEGVLQCGIGDRVGLQLTPFRRTFDPCSDNFRCSSSFQLFSNGLWNQDAIVERGEYVDDFYEDEIMNWTRIGNDDHAGRSAFGPPSDFSIVVRSCSKSSIVYFSILCSLRKASNSGRDEIPSKVRSW